MHRLAECVIEMGFPAQDKGKAVYGIVTVIHEHLDVVENTGIQVLCLIDGQKQGLMLFLIKVCNLFLDCTEHGSLAAPVRNTQDRAELFVKVGDADGGQTQVIHLVKAWIE